MSDFHNITDADDYPIGDYMKVLWNVWEEKYPYPKNYYLTAHSSGQPHIMKPIHLKNWEPQTH